MNLKNPYLKKQRLLKIIKAVSANQCKYEKLMLGTIQDRQYR